MKNVIETKLLEFEKSNFLIELAESTNGVKYVEIIQTINEDNKTHRLMINPSVLSDLIKVLQNYYSLIEKDSKTKKMHINEFDQIEIQKRYLKGVSLKDLSLQFDQTEELIEMILRNKGIEIVSDNGLRFNTAKKYKR